MTFETIKMTGLATLVMSVPALAFAQLSVGDMAGTTEEEIVAKLTASGAEIEEVEIEDGMMEVEYTLDGAEFEVTVDLASGTVTEVEMEDDDEDDDDEDDQG